MPASDLKFEIGHVLFMDIVGYSKLVIDEQTERTRKLNEITRDSPQFRLAEAEGLLVRLPTGDGIALVFRNHPEAPAQCACEISGALRAHPEIKVRMGVHSGPVSETVDVNDRANIAGAGINLAQRVMDCGDAGHILLSKRVADDLDNYARWLPHLHDLGEAEVKHGMRVHLVNLFGEGFGNPQLPTRLKQIEQERIARLRHKRKWQAVGVAIFATLLLAGGLWFYFHPLTRTPPVTTAPVIPEKSIAVLPFENLSAEKEDAFFADGIQDDVLSSLGRFKELKVTGRSSVQAYRGAAVAGKLRAIGESLQVVHVLEGSVRRLANRVVVNVELIDTRSDRQVWSQHYDRTLDDVLSLQGELAIEIARELRATLSPAEKSIAATKPTDNTEAYIAYLRGLESNNKPFAHEPDAVAAEHFFQQAIDLDPNFALARAYLSMLVAAVRPKADASKARVEAEEALRLQPDLGEAHLAHAYYFYRCEENFDQALRELTRAGELLPNSSEVARTTGFIHRGQGNWHLAFADFERALAIDPENTQLLQSLAMNYRNARNWSAAIRIRNRMDALSEKREGPNPHDSHLGRAIDEYYAAGNIGPLQRALDLLKADPEADPFDLHMVGYQVALAARNYGKAETELAKIPADLFAKVDFPSKSRLLARVQSARHDAPALIAATLAPDLQIAQETVAKDPVSFQNHSSLGLVLAFLGRKEDAVREGRLAVEQAPTFHKDIARADLAVIYAKVDRVEEAVTLLERLITRPGLVSSGNFISISWADLRLQPEWDSLRNHPRFKKLVTGPEPVTVY